MGNAGCSLVWNISEGVWKECWLKVWLKEWPKVWKQTRNGCRKVIRKVRKEQVGKLVWAENEEGDKEVAQRKPAPAEGGWAGHSFPLPWPHGPQWCCANLIASNQICQLWLEGADHMPNCPYPTKIPRKLRQSFLTFLLEMNSCDIRASLILQKVSPGSRCGLSKSKRLHIQSLSTWMWGGAAFIWFSVV